MERIDMQFPKSEFTKFELGQVFKSGLDVLMVCKVSGMSSYFLIDLETGIQMSQNYRSLSKMWSAEHNASDLEAAATLIISGGEEQ